MQNKTKEFSVLFCSLVIGWTQVFLGRVADLFQISSLCFFALRLKKKIQNKQNKQKPDSFEINQEVEIAGENRPSLGKRNVNGLLW